MAGSECGWNISEARPWPRRSSDEGAQQQVAHRLRSRAALRVVHSAGLVHRDIKPANILVESDGRVVLADFGLGMRPELIDRTVARSSGTPIFMFPKCSPETRRRRNPICTRSG